MRSGRLFVIGVALLAGFGALLVAQASRRLSSPLETETVICPECDFRQYPAAVADGRLECVECARLFG